MASLEVEPAALRRLAGSLVACAEALGDRRPSMTVARAAAALPGVSAGAELVRCVGVCRQLEVLLTEAARELALRFEAAAQVYEAVDRLSGAGSS